jgi:hypothetical protein
MTNTEVRRYIKANGFTVDEFAKAIGCKPATFKTYLVQGIPQKWVNRIEQFQWDYNNATQATTATKETVGFDVIKEIYASNLSRNTKVHLLTALV